MLYSVYRGMTNLAGPFVPLLLDQRLAAGKEDPDRRAERLGAAQRARPEGRLIWLHGASIGEALSMMTLVRRLLDAEPDLHILLTTGTVTSARVVAGRLPARAFHQFLPVDRIAYVRRFLDHWRPDAVLWVESDLWPNMLTEVARRAIPAALLNARLSERSFRRWMRFRRSAARLLATFSLVLPWDEHQAERLRALGAAKLGPIGNFKFSADPPTADGETLARLQSAIAGRPTWLAASTHDGEERIAAEAHRTIAAGRSGLLTIIAPRHPERADAIAGLLAEQGLAAARRSTGALPTPETDVYLADTLGEMGALLRAAPVVFVGGSLVPHGGHNPIEAAQLETAILYGPHMTNFPDIAAQLETAGGALRVADIRALADALDRLLADPAARRDLAQAAMGVVRRNSDIVDRALVALAPLICPDAGADRP